MAAITSRAHIQQVAKHVDYVQYIMWIDNRLLILFICIFICICHNAAILKLAEMNLNTFQKIIVVFFSTSNIRAAVHRTSAEV